MKKTLFRRRPSDLARFPKARHGNRKVGGRRVLLAPEPLEDRRVLAAGFFQGFESDAVGWQVFGGSLNATQVSSGTNGVTSRTGAFHAETAGVFPNGGGAATPFGPSTAAGYTSAFPAGGYTTAVDVYLDLDGGYANDTRFDWISAINRPDGNHRRDFVFNAGFYNDATGPGAGVDRFVISASTNALRANAFPKNPDKAPIAITSEGWYTFEHRFYSGAGSQLFVDLKILDSNGATINTWTLTDASDVIGTTVGGNRYGWYALQEFSFLAFDNSRQSGPNSVYVDDDWVGLPAGTDPDGPGPANLVGFDAFATIQDGVNAVAAGGTVNVHDGTYEEHVLVNKTVTLLGAQAGVDARTRALGDPSDESVVRGALSGGLRTTSFSVSADNVILDGFTIQDQTHVNQFGAAVYLQGGTEGTEFRNNIVQNNVIGLFLANDNPANPAIIEKNLFRNNTQPGAGSGQSIYADQFTAGGAVRGAVIDNNEFTNTSLVVDSWAIGLSNTGAAAFEDVTISDNEVTNHGRGMYFYHVQGADVLSNNIAGTTNYAIGIFDSGIPNRESSAIEIAGNMLTGNNRGVWVDPDIYLGPLNLTGNAITGGNIALDIAGVATLTLDDNTITGNTTSGAVADIGTLNLRTSSSNEVITIDSAAGELSVQGAVEPLAFAGVATLNVQARGGQDIIDVSPHEETVINIDGGDPGFGDLGVPPGDTLNFDSRGRRFSILANTIVTHGGPPDFQDVTFVRIESVPLSPFGTETLHFDFDATGAGPTQAGYTQVLPTTVYNPGGGQDFGWDSALVSGFDRGPGSAGSGLDDLLRDGHFSSASRTFSAQVTDGWYLVSVKMGDDNFARDQMRITDLDSGAILADNISTAAGQFRVVIFVVESTGGDLNLAFSDAGGDPFWTVNAIEIRPAVILSIGSPDAGPFPADGVTIDTFTGYNAEPNALVTVTAQLDTNNDPTSYEASLVVESVDVAPDIAGVQVQADANGEFTYAIRRAVTGGTAHISFEQVDGNRTGLAVIDYQGEAVRRFDFNHGASPTLTPSNPPTPGGYVGVQPSDLYSPGVGYGWLASQSSVDRGAIGGSAHQNLLRDAHFGSTAGVFQVDLAPSASYEVTVTVGDTAAVRDLINVTVPAGFGAITGGGANVTNITTAAGQFTHRTFTATTNVNGELQLQVSDAGGSNSFWVLNGLSIRPAAAALSVDGPGAPVEADGVTVDTFTVNGATAGAIYTVSSSLGTVTTGDGDTRYAGTQIVAAGASFTFDVQRPSGGGAADVLVEEVSGAERGQTTQQYTVSSVQRFDFNTASSATQGSFTGVAPTALYSPGVGYGWLASQLSFDRGAIGGSAHQNLLRDAHYGTAPGVFQVDLSPSTSYEVTVTIGDTAGVRDLINVTVPAGFGTLDSGAANVTNITTAAGQFTHRTFTATTNASGELRLQVSDAGGSNSFWVLNGLAIRDAAAALSIDGPGAPVEADGVTVDTYTVNGATAGAIYTVSSSLGTVTTSDGDTRYVGRQVVAAGASFTFDVQRPSGGGTADVLVEEVSGAARGATTQQFDFAALRRFDFNGASNDTQGGFTGVRGNHLFSPAAGHGWQTAVPEFQRGTTGYLVSSVPLFRDGHYGTAARTFQVAVTSGETYDVRVYVGDRQFARDQVQVSVEGGTPQAATTAANQFVSLEFLDVIDVGADGILNITISDGGGDPFWVVNGVDVAESTGVGSQLPGAAPQSALGLGEGADSLSTDALLQAKAAAIDVWRQAGASAAELAALASTPLRLAELDGRGAFGLAFTEHVSSILIDDNAGGWGWHTDLSSAPAADRVDLLTVVLHELGHVLGHRDLDLGAGSSNLMSGLLAPGMRRMPEGMPQSIQPGQQLSASLALSGHRAIDAVFAELRSPSLERLTRSSLDHEVHDELPARPGMASRVSEGAIRSVERLSRVRSSESSDDASDVDALFAELGDPQSSEDESARG